MIDYPIQPCPICQNVAWAMCRHQLQVRMLNGKPHSEGTGYYVEYLLMSLNLSTHIVEDKPDPYDDNPFINNEKVIMRLNGLVYMDMERLAKLLVLQ